MAGFGRDFGQKVDLIARIRQALQDYPAGVSMFKEFIQNADDAGARRMQICFDMRSHPAASTAWMKNAEDLQGPALLVYNDAVFDDGDFANITQLGNSDKVSKVNKIGRFGVGVNVMYHLSDVPSFVSRDRFVFFDPHASFLPAVNAAQPGKSIFFLGEDKEVVGEFADMFSPFSAFGFNPDAQFDGTLFRLPLRSQLLAETSRLSSQVYSPDEMQQLLLSFAREMSSCLIFLKSVESIAVSMWSPDAAAPSILHTSSLAAVPRNSFTRGRLDQAAAGVGDLMAPTSHIETVEITTECAVTHACLHETFIVSSQVGCSAEAHALHPSIASAAGSTGKGNINAAALSKQHQKLRLVPLASVAVRSNAASTPPSDNAESPAAADTATLFEHILQHGKTGRLFCFLPLPITSGLPVHVNSTFELSSSRRDIWKLDEGSSGDGAVRGLWNVLVVKDVVVPCYAALLGHLATIGQSTSSHESASELYGLLPPANNVVIPFWKEDVVCSLYAAASSHKLLRDAASGSWNHPMHFTSLVSSHTSADSLHQTLVDVFKQHNVPFLSDGDGIHVEQLELLHEHAGLKHLSPSRLIDVLSSINSSDSSIITHSQAVDIIPYILSSAQSPTQAQTLLASMWPLPVVPVISGQVVHLPQSKNGSVGRVPLRILSVADQDARQFFSSIRTVGFVEPSVATAAVIQFFSYVKSECDVDQLSPADVPALLSSLCDINDSLNADSIKSVWAHLLLRSDEWYAFATDFAVVPAFGKFLRPMAAAQCCYLVDGDVHIPAAVMLALEANGVASVQFSSLALNANATHPRWLEKAFLGHRGNELVVALRDAMQPGGFQDVDQCDALRRFFFSELKQYGEEWGEASRLALKQLPIHKMGTLHSSTSLTPYAAIDDENIIVGPTVGVAPIDSSWLNGSFVVASGSDEEISYESLRIPKINSVYWYTHYFFPCIDELDSSVRIAALQRLLDHFQALGADHNFTEFLKKNGRFVTAGGALVRVEELAIPSDPTSALIMDPSCSPAPDLLGEFRSPALISLGARSRPSKDDIKRACTVLAAATKSGWTAEATQQSVKYLATAAAAVENVSSIVAAVQGESNADAMDTAARALSVAAQLFSCASLHVAPDTLPNIFRLLALCRHFLTSHADQQFSHRDQNLHELFASLAPRLCVKVGSFFDEFCKDNISVPFSSEAPNQSSLATTPGTNIRPDMIELVRRFELTVFPAIFYLPSDDPILIELLNVGLRHIDNMVVNHGLNAVISVRCKLPELVSKKTSMLWSCFCGVDQPSHLAEPWGSADTVKAIRSVSAELWLPTLASMQYIADALIEVAETCAAAGESITGQMPNSFPSAKLSRLLHRRSSLGRPSSHPTSVAGGRYEEVRSYDLASLLSANLKQGVCLCEKKLLESAHLTLHNLHALARVLVRKTLVYDFDSSFYCQLFVVDINLLDLIKSCVLDALANMKKMLKGDSGSNSNVIVLLAAAAHAVTLSLVDDAVLNGGPSRKFTKSLAVKLDAQLQNAQHVMAQWLQDNVANFVPAFFPSLFRSKHFEFLMTEILPMMQRESSELVSLFRASYAKAQSHVPISSPYFLSRIVLARDDGDSAAAAFSLSGIATLLHTCCRVPPSFQKGLTDVIRREMQSNELQRDYLNAMNRPPSTIFDAIASAGDV